MFFFIPSIGGLFALGAIVFLLATGGLKALLWAVVRWVVAVAAAGFLWGYISSHWSRQTR